MNTLPLILTCLASGAAGAGALHLMTPEATTQEVGQNDELVSALDSLRADMRAQNDTIDSLTQTIDRMEDEASLVAPIIERSQVPESTSSGSDAIPASASTGSAIKIGQESISQAQFQDWVRQANNSIREQEQAERDAERKIREGERVEERVAELTTTLGLDSRQQSEFRRHFEEQNVKRNDMRQAMRDGTIDRGDMREAWTEIRAAADTDLQTFLSGEQYETYKESDDDRFGGRGGRGNRGGGGNNARGGNNGGGRNN